MRSFARLGIACLALPALALAATDPWLRITSSNFELLTTAGERTGRDLIRHFEQVRSFFLQNLPHPRPGGFGRPRLQWGNRTVGVRSAEAAHAAHRTQAMPDAADSAGLVRTLEFK